MRRSVSLGLAVAAFTASVGISLPAAAASVATTAATASGVVAHPAQRAASVVWRVPSGDLAGITGYRVVADPGGASATTTGPTATAAVVGGLTDGTAYTFTVTALTQAGSGSPSAPSGQVVPYALADVATDSAYSPYVRALVDEGVSAGCAVGDPGSVRYCPAESVKRGDMAIFLARGKLGAQEATSLPEYTDGFVDVLPSDYFSRHVRYLRDQRITSGCASDRYCPAAAVTRGDMAVFLAATELGRDGLDALPPYAGGFSDVAAGDYFSRAVQWAKDAGITAGCGNGAYCPQQPVTREQMAIFLVRTFDLPFGSSRGPAVDEVQPTSGGSAGGTLVDLFGRRLGSATEVRFGSVAGTELQVVDDGHLRVRAPAGAGRHDVFVSTSEGPSAGPSGGTFSYTDAPVLRNVEPSSGSTGGGDSVVLTGSGFDGTEQVLFGDAPATDVRASADGASLTVTSPAAASGDVGVRVARGDATSAPVPFRFSDAPHVQHVLPDSGATAGGTRIHVTGQNLAGATAVHVGAGAATGITVAADGRSLEAVTPAAAEGTTSQVTVTTPTGTSTGGETSALDDRFTHTDRPRLDYVEPSRGTVAGGTEVTLHGQALQDTSQVLVGGRAAELVSRAPDGRSLVVRAPAASAAGPVQVEASTADRETRPPADPDATTFTYTDTGTTSVTAAALASLPYECQQVLFFGARGSGQEPLGSVEDSESGMGAQVFSAYQRLDEQLGGRRKVAPARVVFPAASVSKLAFAADEYFSGLSEGVEWTVRQIDNRADRCPHERLVLAGYSQGAMVMHRVVNRLTVRGSPHLRRVDGVILLADGDRVAHDTSYFHGTGHAGRSGIGLQLPSQSGSTTTRFPSWVGDRVHSVCNAEDPVCDATGALLDVAYTKRHFKYVGTPAVHEAADAVASRVLSSPLPTPRLIEAQVTVGQPFDHQLTADIDSGSTLEWQVAIPSVLPAGLSLTPDGRLSGTPTAAPTGGTLLRVRGAILGVAGSWTSATVEWTDVPPPAPAPVSQYTPGLTRSVMPGAAFRTHTSCVSATFCMATLDSGFLTIWNGTRWVLQPRLPLGALEQPHVLSLSCSSTTDCMLLLVGSPSGSPSNAYALRWDGSTWSSPHRVLDGTYEGRLTCARASCMLTSQNRYATWNGAEWSAVQTLEGVHFRSTSCATASSCVALVHSDPLGNGFATWNGSTWSAPQRIDADSASAAQHTSLSCASATRCIATAGYSDGALVHEWDGSTWRALPAAPVFVPADSLSCTGTSFCATGGNGTYATLQGGTWSVISSWDMMDGSISCTSETFCAVIGDNPSSLATMPGYRARIWTGSWSNTQAGIAPDSTRLILSCTSDVFCMAVDGSWFTTWNGTAWAMPQRFYAYSHYYDYYDYGSHGVATSIDCAAPTFCMVLGAGFDSVTWNGSSWGSPQRVGNNGSSHSSVACPTVDYCVGAARGESTVRVWTGAWGQEVSTGVRMSDLDCSAPSACFVVGSSVATDSRLNVSVGDGSTWTPVDVGSRFTSRASCATDGCLISGEGDQGEQLFATDGTSVRSVALPSNGVEVFSCAAARACLNVSNYSASLWNGASWTSVTARNLISTSSARDALSCAPDGYCAGAVYNGGTIHSGRLS